MSRPGEDRWLRSSNPSTVSPEREEKLDRFMERWVELDEAVTGYLGNQRREGDGRKTEQKERFRPTPQHTHNKSKSSEQKHFYSEKGNNWKTEERKQVECFWCGRKGHIKRDCRVKLEEANFVRDQDNLPKWARPVKINGSPVLGLIDTGCT